MKNKKIMIFKKSVKISVMLMRRLLPFVLIAATYSLLYIMTEDRYVLLSSRSSVKELITYVFASYIITLLGSFATGLAAKDAE